MSLGVIYMTLIASLPLLRIGIRGLRHGYIACPFEEVLYSDASERCCDNDAREQGRSRRATGRSLFVDLVFVMI